MRLFEALLLLLDLILLIPPLCKPLKERKWSLILIGLAVFLLVIHLLWEGYRWQMIPSYLLTAHFVVRNAMPSRERGRGRMIAGLLLNGVILAVGVAALLLLPVPRLPTPSGPYDIGTVTYHWVDEAREEIYAGDGAAPRELMVQIWYPAKAPAGVRPGLWREDGLLVSRAMTKQWGYPIFLLDQLGLTRSHAYDDVPLASAEQRYPIIVYLHGWSGYRNVNPDQLEALASHGYVVVSADHAYGALLTVFPDGRIAHVNPAAMDGDGTKEGRSRAAETLVGVWADDVSFVLDQVEALNANDPDGRFTGRLDFERLGLFGHSTGGGAAVRFCAADERCQAILGMDAWLEPVPDELIATNLSQPLLLMNSEAWSEGENVARQRQLYDGLAGAGYWMTIQGTGHWDFVIVPSLTPLAHALDIKGPLPGPRAMEINDSYLLAFFDKHLAGRSAPLLDGPSSSYPEVQFEARD